MENKVVIGIDLGTSFTCASVVRNGLVEVIQNKQGSRNTPSFVSFDENDCLVGEAARNQAITNPENTIYESKRLIGKNANDKSIESFLKQWPFTVEYQNEKLKFEVEYKKNKKTFCAEELGALILSEVKESCEEYLNCEICDVVITVPAHFNDSQRQATRTAGKLAGLNVVQIINEPTAAAFAYGLHQLEDEFKKLLVYDIGGGTTDVTILSVEEKNFKVLSTNGDSKLGGADFDSMLMDYCLKVFSRENKIEICKTPKMIRRLKSACEKAKICLSTSTHTSVQVDCFFQTNDLNVKISRALFEDICRPLFNRALIHVQNALDDSKLDKSQIDTVLIIGGSSRIPKLQKMLHQFFNKKSLSKNIHPDEAVAIGAATFANFIENNSGYCDEISLQDISSKTIGVNVEHGVMDVLIERNTSIPVTVNRVYTTFYDNQTTVKIEVFEGDDKLTKNNRLLAEFCLENIEKASAGEVEVEVTFYVNSDGILKVSAKEYISEREKEVVVKFNDSFNENEIKDMMSNLNLIKENQIEITKTKNIKNSIEEIIIEIEIICSEHNNLSSDVENRVNQLLSLKTFENDTVEILEEKLKKLHNLKNEIIAIPTLNPVDIAEKALKETVDDLKMEMKKTLDSKQYKKKKKYEDAIKRAENCIDSDYKNIREVDGHQRLITTLLEDLQNSYYQEKSIINKAVSKENISGSNKSLTEENISENDENIMKKYISEKNETSFQMDLLEGIPDYDEISKNFAE